MGFYYDGCVEKQAEKGLHILLTNIHNVQPISGCLTWESELQKNLIQVLLKFVLVLIAHGNVCLTENKSG